MLKTKHGLINEHIQCPYPDVQRSNFHFNQHFLLTVIFHRWLSSTHWDNFCQSLPKFVFLLRFFSLPEIMVILTINIRTISIIHRVFNTGEILLSILHTWLHFTFTASLWSWICYVHFTDEDTEAQRYYITSYGHTNNKIEPVWHIGHTYTSLFDILPYSIPFSPA